LSFGQGIDYLPSSHRYFQSDFVNIIYTSKIHITTKITTNFILHAQKDMTNFRLKVAVTLFNCPWNKIKTKPGYKPTFKKTDNTLEDNDN
jgi:hypothetical protein